MTWFDKWTRRRANVERKALAASVEELTTQEKAEDNEWEEEEDDMASTGGTAIIPPLLRLQSRSLPIVRLDRQHEPRWETRTPSSAPLAVAPGKRLGRSTKVHLQAVRPEQVQEPSTEHVPAIEMAVAEPRESGHDRQVIVRRIEPLATTSSASAHPSLLCGSGVIEIGHEDATVHHQRISAQSVVTVMLTGNPGPVVVHYVTLQPRAGFTLHLSAPVTATTPFNYAIWFF